MHFGVCQFDYLVKNMHFGACQFDYLAKYAYLLPKCWKNHCFLFFANNPSYSSWGILTEVKAKILFFQVKLVLSRE